LLINQFVHQLHQEVVVVKLLSLFAAITAYIVHTSPVKANPSKNRLIRSVLPQFRTLYAVACYQADKNYQDVHTTHRIRA